VTRSRHSTNCRRALPSLLKDARPSLASDIKSLGDVATTLNENKGQVDSILTHLPNKLATLTRTVTYGLLVQLLPLRLRRQDRVGPLCCQEPARSSPRYSRGPLRVRRMTIFRKSFQERNPVVIGASVSR